jgi:hypothetical protein
MARTQILNCPSVASNQTNLRHQLGMDFEMLHNPNTSRMMSADRFVRERPSPDRKAIAAARTTETEPDHDDDDDDDDADEEDEDEGYDLTCCGAMWRQDSKFNLVCCNKCKDWRHIGPVGDCEGECVALRDAKSAKHFHLCIQCQNRHKA